MSKRIKNLIEKELSIKLQDIDSVAVVNPRGINATKNNLMRRRLHDKGLRMAVVKNTLARRATSKTKIAGFERLLDGPSAVVYGKVAPAIIARALMEEKKLDETIELRGLYFDGEIYVGEKGIKQASTLPTREEAVAGIVAAILGPGKKLAGALKGPGGKLGAVLKAIEESAQKKEADAAAPAPAAA